MVHELDLTAPIHLIEQMILSDFVWSWRAVANHIVWGVEYRDRFNLTEKMASVDTDQKMKLT
jgi:hypothetical protein